MSLLADRRHIIHLRAVRLQVSSSLQADGGGSVEVLVGPSSPRCPKPDVGLGGLTIALVVSQLQVLGHCGEGEQPLS